MDKRLEKAKKEIQRQNLMMSFITIGSLLSLINVDRLTRGYENHDLASFMTFFYLGLLVISNMIILFYLVRNQMYAKDEKALLRIYNEMHDERTAKIKGIVAQNTLAISILFILNFPTPTLIPSNKEFLGIILVELFVTPS